MGIFVRKDMQVEPKFCDANEAGVCYTEEKFENLVVKLPQCIDTGYSSRKRNLVLVVVYRQPNSGNLDFFLDRMEQLLKKKKLGQ